MDNFFKDKYPPGVPSEVELGKYKSVVDMFEQACKRYADKPAFTAVGATMTYGEMEKHTRAFAAYLQNETNLKPGDRIAIQMPNLLQYPIAVFGAMRAGLIVVNTNPLYTPREMEHQFNDSGAKALVVLANMASQAQEVLPHTGVEHVIVAQIPDMHPPIKRMVMNAAIKYVKKMVPPYNIPNAVPFTKVMSMGARYTFKPVDVNPEDIAVLQYTGGTTGVAKGAMLTHRNLVSNVAQLKPLLTVRLGEAIETVIAPLPLYHIYSFTMNCGVMLDTGNHSILIPNPRDFDGFIKELGKWKFTAFLGINTLFVALCNNEKFQELDFTSLKVTAAGGMALTSDTAKMWKKVTGCDVTEGYGMTETSPVVSINPMNAIQIGTIGLPIPNTMVKIMDDEGKDLTVGEVGELCVKGPQVMKGYWQRPDETAKTMTEDGWLKTGDIAMVQNDGYLRIVDRKKDMILVSGFNVYPNEIEDVVTSHPDVVECAAIGVPDLKSGEVVKVFVVKSNPNLTESALKEFCRERLTAYKVPKTIEFRDELPKTNVGKILRRELRDEEIKKQKDKAA
ncbi:MULTISPECIES: long-chain fatty acid--CoA ligase [unclassified Hahella]|uniref:long-chain fatty acid--CoA ligase n=1 Tax=unclassified Hahella TaxID=2624107 RepID=UPI000FDD407B|nr:MULTISPECIES: long-chain fatty acid--CoA ligase [unclassified Hahella]AZZ93067.1 long-chain fatty acid--CoA ligase [Hahella sp. KA22]MBU6950528.1 long-chain fatty acid--CoA ligase [Hahella sp. HN01]MDG9667931.1 long-chain fatty acid--CoA ligase [Hahella sp. CR1]QAY56441.1 long-chain fatty acid--CoA ligase [Hahella sp. KA22]